MENDESITKGHGRRVMIEQLLIRTRKREDRID